MRRDAVRVLLVLAGLGAGCAPDAPPPPPPPPRPPEPALAPLTEIAFPEWADVDDEKPVELPGLAWPQEPLRWDFSSGRRFAYDFSQTLDQLVAAVALGVLTETRSRDRNRGTFEFVGTRDKCAKAFILIQTQEAVRNGVTASPEEIKKNPPSKFECTVYEDGQAETRKLAGRSDAQFFFDTILALGEGEKAVKDGTVRTRRAGSFKVGRHECLRLETEFELAPETASGQTRMRGRTIAYWAPKERLFVRTATAVATTTRLNALNANIGWITNALDSKTVFRLKLLE